MESPFALFLMLLHGAGAMVEWWILFYKFHRPPTKARRIIQLLCIVAAYPLWVWLPVPSIGKVFLFYGEILAFALIAGNWRNSLFTALYYLGIDAIIDIIRSFVIYVAFESVETTFFVRGSPAYFAMFNIQQVFTISWVILYYRLLKKREANIPLAFKIITIFTSFGGGQILVYYDESVPFPPQREIWVVYVAGLVISVFIFALNMAMFYLYVKFFDTPKGPKPENAAPPVPAMLRRFLNSLRERCILWARNGKSAAACGWLAFFCWALMVYLTFVLFNFIPAAYAGARYAETRNYIYLLNFAGMALGALVCPFFLPLPERGKSPAASVAFIGLLVLPQIVIRSLGVDFWLGSAPARLTLALSSGMIHPAACGLFYLACLRNRTGRWASFLAAAAIMGAMVVHTIAPGMLERAGLAAQPAQAMALLFSVIKVAAIEFGIAAALCAISLAKTRAAPQEAACAQAAISRRVGGYSGGGIIRLIALSALFMLLNALFEMRFFPFSGWTGSSFSPFFPVVLPAVLFLSFLSGRAPLFSANGASRFLRLFLLLFMSLFIFMPVLALFNAHSFFAACLNNLIFIASCAMWFIFTTAAAEYGAAGGRRLYLCVSSVIMTHSLAFFGSVLLPYIPKGQEWTVLITAVAAVVFSLLAFKTLFSAPRLSEPLPAVNAPEAHTALPPAPVAAPVAISAEALFKEHGLTVREMEVARLILEGLSNDEIAVRIFRSTITVEKHITNIYRKFEVANRPAFAARFISQ